MIQSTDDRSRSPDGAPRNTFTLALVADLLFAARVRGAAAAVGAPARTVSTPEALLREARAHRPDLVLVDLDARGIDVPALIAMLKTDPELAAVPVIAFGAHVNRPAIDAARAAGADRVLARSAFVRELPALVRGTDVADSPAS